MTVLTALSFVVFGTAALLILWSGFGHLTRVAESAQELAGLLPVGRRLMPPVTILLGSVELVLGALLIGRMVGVITGAAVPLAAASLFAIFTVAQLSALGKPAVSCGCFTSMPATVSAMTVTRAGVLAALLAGCSLAPTVFAEGFTLAENAILLLAVVSFTPILYALPTAGQTGNLSDQASVGF